MKPRFFTRETAAVLVGWSLYRLFLSTFKLPGWNHQHGGMFWASIVLLITCYLASLQMVTGMNAIERFWRNYRP